jgi:hypothetical protein
MSDHNPSNCDSLANIHRQQIEDYKQILLAYGGLKVKYGVNEQIIKDVQFTVTHLSARLESENPPTQEEIKASLKFIAKLCDNKLSHW